MADIYRQGLDLDCTELVSFHMYPPSGIEPRIEKDEIWPTTVVALKEVPDLDHIAQPWHHFWARATPMRGYEPSKYTQKVDGKWEWVRFDAGDGKGPNHWAYFKFDELRAHKEGAHNLKVEVFYKDHKSNKSFLVAKMYSWEIRVGYQEEEKEQEEEEQEEESDLELLAQRQSRRGWAAPVRRWYTR